ncbi:MAG TPA: DUF5666 domain-containing protein [Dongiaceae bacterium]|nr:DUF5666 domain-containing protein [Dongiaceae bacterium]
MPNAAKAQTKPDAPSAAMISPKSERSADAAIEPAKPSISEDADDTSIAVDPTTLLPDLPPVPKANATLVGGTVERLDAVRDRVTLRLFGGGKETVLFDPRTHVVRGTQPATIADLRQGERIYVDTILDGDTIFARTIRLTAEHATGTSQGVILEARLDRGMLTFRDALSPAPIQVRVNASTKVMEGNRVVPLGAIKTGSLVTVSFSSSGDKQNFARDISILAQPGSAYTFSGQVAHIDLRTGLVVLNSSTDHKTYEVYLSPSITPDENLHVGANVTLDTSFDGQRYVARNMSINSY